MNNTQFCLIAFHDSRSQALRPAALAWSVCCSCRSRASRSAFMTRNALVSGSHHRKAIMKTGGAAPNQNRDRQPCEVVGTSCEREYHPRKTTFYLRHGRTPMPTDIPWHNLVRRVLTIRLVHHKASLQEQSPPLVRRGLRCQSRTHRLRLTYRPWQFRTRI